VQLGVDIGGTKVEVAVLAPDGTERLRRRAPVAPGGYRPALESLASLILEAEREAGEACSVGVGMPGKVSPQTGLVANAYNTPFNGEPLKVDLEALLGREARFANDANCFVLSEAVDGAARGAQVVFGAILGTGVGGGFVVGGAVLNGRHAISGEWGHDPLPWMSADEYPGPRCNCGRLGCIEQFLSGPALGRERAAYGEDLAMARYEDRLGRALAMVVNLIDPDVIVIGGGLSNLDRLYANVPRLMPRHVYSEYFDTPVVRALHGDASGVRGAARLWP
jgi:fructokinase